MNVNSISARAIQYKHHEQIVQEQRRHEEILQQQRHAKIVHDDQELKRIEANRRMNRPGQNIDKFA